MQGEYLGFYMLLPLQLSSMWGSVLRDAWAVVVQMWLHASVERWMWLERHGVCARDWASALSANAHVCACGEFGCR